MVICARGQAALAIVGAVAAGLISGPASAAPATYTDVAAFNAAVAAIPLINTQVIDFEFFAGQNGGTAGDVIASGSTIQGVTFTPSLPHGFELAVDGTGGTSGSNVLGASSNSGVAVGQFGLGDVVDFSLSQPTLAFGMFIVTNSGFNFFADDATLSAAGTSVTNPTGVAGTDVNGVNALFLGIVDDLAAFNAASIQFGPTPGAFSGAFFEIDDIVVYTAPVPIPAALPLFLTGLAALGFTGWRRRNTV